MTAYGILQDDIAAALKMSDDTLRKFYADEIRIGATMANAKVAKNLFVHATGTGPGAVTAAIFWAKTRMGWRETNHTEITGKDGGPIALTDLSKLTDEQLAALEPVLRALAASGAPPGASTH